MKDKATSDTITVAFRVTAEQAEILQTMAEQQGVKRSKVLQDAVSELIEDHKAGEL
jgi:predicted DNA-binding protein